MNLLQTLDIVESLPPNYIFVFGSNEMGLHRRGAAKTAMVYFKAKYKMGSGLQGRCYAIPTKKTPYKSLELYQVKNYVDIFLRFATLHQEYRFYVTPIGTGLANFSIEDIRPLFRRAHNIPNIILHKDFYV